MILNKTNKNLLITIGFMLFVTTISFMVSFYLTKGNFTYALDDPYIHMSTVKHFVQQGIWSVDGNTYASASSSPLWVFVLSLFYFLLGAKFFIYVPFVLNILFQVLSLILVFNIVKKFTQKDLHYLFGMTIVLFTPFIALSFGGMEHSLQIYLILLFIKYLMSYIQNPNLTKNKIILLVISPFVVFVRYEDFALILVTSLVILFYFKNLKFFISLILSSLILVVLFGMWSKFVFNLGFLPSSIIAKSMIGSEMSFIFQIKSIIGKFASQLLQPHIVALYILNLLIVIKLYLSNKKNSVILVIIFIATLFIHLAFAKLGWLYRYEAYLVLFGILNILLYIYSYYNIKIKWIIVAIFSISLIFAKQIILAPYTSIMGSKNIYEQQIQMANFLQQKCDTCSIAANDIGAITYFTNIHLLDLYGLGSYEVIEHKKNGTYTNETINELLKNKNIELVIIYEHWFENITLNDYTKIAEWKILENKVCGGDTVAFYSLNNKIDENFLKVKRYSENTLPSSVIVNFMDLKQ